jgi:NADH-ubiquinone oxidoreductase chain 6
MNYYLSLEGNNSLLLEIITFVSILSSILVVSTSNPVISVLFLISLFICISLYLVILGITYIGLTYIIVYVGAVTILFLFVIMLLDIKLSELQLEDNSKGFPIGIILGISFIYPLINNQLIYWIEWSTDTQNLLIKNIMNWFINMNHWITNPISSKRISNNIILDGKIIESQEDIQNIQNIQNSIEFLKNKEEYTGSLDKLITTFWDNNIYNYSHISSIGNLFYTTYAIWFIIISIILLLAMIGAISLTLKTKE